MRNGTGNLHEKPARGRERQNLHGSERMKKKKKDQWKQGRDRQTERKKERD